MRGWVAFGIAFLGSALPSCSSSDMSVASSCFVNGMCVPSADCVCSHCFMHTSSWSEPGTDASGTTPNGADLCRSDTFDGSISGSEYEGDICFGLAYGASPACTTTATAAELDCTVGGTAYAVAWNASSNGLSSGGIVADESSTTNIVARVAQSSDSSGFDLTWGQGQSGKCTISGPTVTLCYSTAPDTTRCF